jgi:hypothetical protein
METVTRGRKVALVRRGEKLGGVWKLAERLNCLNCDGCDVIDEHNVWRSMMF